MTLATTTGERLAVPFAYAEAGHLTHGYATTIHKAQGATVDRCFILADDTMTREHAYTALSRGRHGNDLFLVTDDRRVEERDTPEIDVDPLDAVRRALGRSAGKRMALDEVESVVAPIEQLCQERDGIRARLGDGPADTSLEYRRLSEARIRERHGLEGAQWRLGTARQSLQHLGSIGRWTRRTDRREFERRVAGFEADIDRHGERLADLEERLAELTPEMLTRTTWERDHSTELHRLDTLDRQIDLSERLEHVATRHLNRELEQGLDLGR